MVKIPELTEDGQNWKIYRTKFLKAAATYDCLKVLAGRPYEGDDWDGCNTLLCCTFMESILPSIYFPIRYRTAHENFKYLVKRFCDNDPIPHTNEFQCTGTAAAAEMPENYPTSANTATERHANAKLDEEDLSTTKALTRGTQDVNGGNTGHTEDPRMSLEASAKGTSTERTDGTIVLCAATPHETQDQPQDSLQTTPRLPTKGKPSECEQEAEESVQTARRTNGTAQSANPPKMDTDIDPEKAVLGGDLAERACGVDEGNRTECKDLQLPKAELYCKEGHQHNGNAEDTIPSTYRFPLKGEWTGYASSEARDPRSSANVPNAMPECVHCPSESSETEDAEGVKSEGCEGGTDELMELLTMSVEPYVEDGELSACVCLGGMRCHVGDANRLGNRADASSYQVDGLGGLTDAPSTSNGAETEVIGHGEGAGTYLATGDTKHGGEEMDGVRSHTDASTRHTDTQSIEMHVINPANVPKNVSIPGEKDKPPNLPMEAAMPCSEEPDGCRDHAEGSNAHTHAHSIGIERKTAANETESVRTRQTEEKT